MSGPEFFQTGYGRKYYEHDFPQMVNALQALAKSAERIAAVMEKFQGEFNAKVAMAEGKWKNDLQDFIDKKLQEVK